MEMVFVFFGIIYLVAFIIGIVVFVMFFRGVGLLVNILIDDIRNYRNKKNKNMNNNEMVIYEIR